MAPLINYGYGGPKETGENHEKKVLVHTILAKVSGSE